MSTISLDSVSFSAWSTPNPADWAHVSPADEARADIKGHVAEHEGGHYQSEATAASSTKVSSATHVGLSALHPGGQWGQSGQYS